MSPGRLLSIVLLGAALATPAAAAAGEVYRWTDSEGKVHYGDNPPSGTEAERISPEPGTIETGSPSAGEGDGAGAGPTEGGSDDGGGSAPARQGPSPEEQARRCGKIRDRLTTLRNNPRLLIEGDDGEMRRMPEEERQSRISDLERMLDEQCADGGG